MKSYWHRTKLMPTQWRSVSQMTGRTAAHNQYRYKTICLISLQSEARGLKRLIWLFYYIIETVNDIPFRARCYQKYARFQKKLQMKVAQNWTSHKKVPERKCLSPYGAELGASKDWYGCYIYCWNCKWHSIKAQGYQKIRIFSKRASNESCSNLNFV